MTLHHITDDEDRTARLAASLLEGIAVNELATLHSDDADTLERATAVLFVRRPTAPGAMPAPVLAAWLRSCADDLESRATIVSMNWAVAQNEGVHTDRLPSVGHVPTHGYGRNTDVTDYLTQLIRRDEPALFYLPSDRYAPTAAALLMPRPSALEAMPVPVLAAWTRSCADWLRSCADDPEATVGDIEHQCHMIEEVTAVLEQPFADDPIFLGEPHRLRRGQFAGERSHELHSRMLEENIIFLGEPIDDVVANRVCAQMVHLESENPDKEICVYINSPGGGVSSLFAIYDTSQNVCNDIMTVCLGEASGAAAVLLAAGTPGKRMALPNARVVLCRPFGSAMGQAADIELRAREIDLLNLRIAQIAAHHTGQDPERIRADTERDFVMDAEAAKEYGVIDQVIIDRVITGHQTP